MADLCEACVINLKAGSRELRDLANRLTNTASVDRVQDGQARAQHHWTQQCRDVIELNTIEEVNSFKSLGATVSKDGRRPADIHTRITTTATTAMAKLDRKWPVKAQALPLITSLQAPHSSLKLSKLLQISYKEHKSNSFVMSVVVSLVGSQETLLTSMNRFHGTMVRPGGHVARLNTLYETLLQGSMGGWPRMAEKELNVHISMKHLLNTNVTGGATWLLLRLVRSSQPPMMIMMINYLWSCPPVSRC